MTWRGLALAAVLACGRGAALSHRSAAYLWRLLPYPAKRGPVDVTVAGRNPGLHPGIRVHRAAIDRREVRIRDGILVTTPGRTIVDLAAVTRPDELELAVAEAFALRLTSRAPLLALVERHRGRPGVAELRRQLDGDRTPARTRSRPERRLLALIRRANLPEPEVNARIGRWEVDLLWREQRLAVEVDGYASHSSPWAFDRDHLKTAELEEAGYAVRRVSARQVTERPRETVARIARRL